MQSTTKQFGDQGEEIAAKYLEGIGFTIVERNYRSKVGEIDLIATKGRLLIFCEVKSRFSLLYGQPAEAVTKKKIWHIRSVASRYLTQYMRIKHLYDDFDIRFDVLELVFSGTSHENEFTVNHLEDAF